MGHLEFGKVEDLKGSAFVGRRHHSSNESVLLVEKLGDFPAWANIVRYEREVVGHCYCKIDNFAFLSADAQLLLGPPLFEHAHGTFVDQLMLMILSEFKE